MGIPPLVKLIDVAPAAGAKVPVHPVPVNEAAGGVSTTKVAGKESVNETLLRALLGSLLTMLMVRVLVCPAQTVVGLKFLFNDGASTVLTLKVALAGVTFVMVSAPPLAVAVNAPTGMLLTRLPGMVDVTSTETVHEPCTAPLCAGTVPPLSASVVPPATAVTEPPQLLTKLTGLASRIPG